MDVALVDGPDDTGLNIVSRADLKKHRRISLSNAALDEEIDAAIKEAAEAFHGKNGELNRTIFPCTWVRYLPRFPTHPVIRLPYPPLIEVLSVQYDDGEGSPQPAVSPSSYIVRTDTLVGEIELLSTATWPTAIAHPRAVAVTYRAGYETYPEQLKRAVKILASHYLTNKEAVEQKPSRPLEFGLQEFRAKFRVPVAYDEWE